jgi:hypothetical protein
MVWFDKGEGTGRQSVNIRDGKRTKRGKKILHELLVKRTKRGCLSPGNTRMLRALQLPGTRDAVL